MTWTKMDGLRGKSQETRAQDENSRMNGGVWKYGVTEKWRVHAHTHRARQAVPTELEEARGSNSTKPVCSLEAFRLDIEHLQCAYTI